MDDKRLQDLNKAIERIEKDFGKGSIMRLGDSASIDVEASPTGIPSIDIALGIGGLPKGRIIEIYGTESGGKTTFALTCIAESQRNKGLCAFIDAEHSLDPVYARAIGVDTDKLLISQPDTGEQALEITEELVRSRCIDIIVIDSVAALVPKAEIDGEMGDSHMGLQARLMSQALRKLTGIVGKTKTIVIFINQLRKKIGISWGNPETTSGGEALKYYASVRLDIRKTDVIKKDGQEYGNKVRLKVIKNKVAPPFKIAEFDIIYGKGIDAFGSLFDVAVDKGVIQKAGSWYNYGEIKLGQGKDKAIEFIKSDEKLLKKIKKEI
jgi:recombination protein RecA